MAKPKRKSMEQIIRADGRYPIEAFGFLQEAMSSAIKTAYSDELPISGQPHVSGQQISQACREMALERWGMLARTVLEKWNIRSTIDFGKMVYLLIEHGLMKKTDEDGVEDFENVYDFDEAVTVDDDFEVSE